MRDLQIDDSGHHERPISMLMFEQRKLITCLTTLRQERHGIMGLQVTFEDNESILLGSDEPCRPSVRLSTPSTLLKTEMSFDVSAGEEIIALDVLQDRYVLAIKVSYSEPPLQMIRVWHGTLNEFPRYTRTVDEPSSFHPTTMMGGTWKLGPRKEPRSNQSSRDRAELLVC